MRIMVVDDEKDIAPLFRQRFKKEIREGLFNFHFAFSAEDALQYLRTMDRAEVVLILSDINMPGMNGLELLRILKQDFPHLKVFMITAYGDKEKHETAVRYGADEYLTKPIDFEALKNEIIAIKHKG